MNKDDTRNIIFIDTEALTHFYNDDFSSIKILILKKISKECNAEIIITDSYKPDKKAFWDIHWGMNVYNKRFNRLHDLFDRYNIPIRDITPLRDDNLIDKDADISKWILRHSVKLGKFVIIDRDYRIKTENLKSHLVAFNRHSYIFNGLQPRHISECVNIIEKVED